VETLAKFPGTKHTELKLGVRKTEDGFEPCDFFDKDVWYRGIVDLLITDGWNAHMIDYKTGKNAKYADMKQLDLMAGAVFVHFPEVLRVKSGLAYVVSNEFLKKTHVRTELSQYMGVFDRQLGQLEDAMQAGVAIQRPQGPQLQAGVRDLPRQARPDQEAGAAQRCPCQADEGREGP